MLTPSSPARRPAAKKQPRGILKKDRANKEDTPCNASASTPSRRLSSKLPARSPLVPTLPNQEERRSTGPTASSRLKSRQRETYFVFSTEPPPMPTLPIVPHPTILKSANREWSKPRVAVPLPLSNLLRPKTCSNTGSVGSSKVARGLSSNTASTLNDSRGSLAPHGTSASQWPSTSTFEPASIGLHTPQARTQRLATPRLGLPGIDELSGRQSTSSRERVAPAPGLDTISESASLDSTLSAAHSLETSVPGYSDVSFSQTSIHRIEREARRHVPDQFPIPRHASFSATRLPSSSSHFSDPGSCGATQPVSANRHATVPRGFAGSKAPAQALRIGDSPTPGEAPRGARSQPGLRLDTPVRRCNHHEIDPLLATISSFCSGGNQSGFQGESHHQLRGIR